MIERFEAKVIEPPKQIKAKYGFCSLLKCQVLNSGEDFVVFGKEGDPKILSRDRGEVVSVFKDHTGKYRLLDGVVDERNGNGLQPISEPLNKISQPDKVVGSGHIPDLDEDDLDLPYPLTPKQKKDLKRLTAERAALLRFCIDTMRKELIEMGSYEFHENSIRSLGVSLFIHINKYLP